MSPIRPEREQEGDPAQPSARRAPAPRAVPVSDPDAVRARLDGVLSRCRRRHEQLVLLCIAVETVRGPDGPVADDLERRVRQEVAHRIGHAVRAGDDILRAGERDTCVVLHGAPATATERVARRLARLLNGDYGVAGTVLRAEVRVGAAACPEHGLRAYELLRQAGVVAAA